MAENTRRFRVPPEVGYDDEQLASFLQSKIKSPYRIIRRSIDARKRQTVIDLEVTVYEDTVVPELISYQIPTKDVSQAPSIIIVGAGPAGLFAGLKCVELGLKPIVLERGKDVRARRRDLAAINKSHVVNPESNYCFGEGGAGTYSDGKLYTRSKKRGDLRRILEILVAHGATEKILMDAHPHIGTNKLPRIITAMRESICHAGGEVHFDTKVTAILRNENRATGVATNQGDFTGEGIVLATGHSARDIFDMLHHQQIAIEQKPFALGVRVEHAQSLIDQIQYKNPDRGAYLPASSYSLVSQTYVEKKQRGVFSFCMCPGGFIVPAATSPGEVVVNGMSPSRRDSKYANSGIVVAIEKEDMAEYASYGALAGIKFQESIEQRACALAGNSQQAPAQRLQDFLQGKISKTLLPTSYQPGLVSVNMEEVLGLNITKRLRDAFRFFGRKMKGYVTNEAQIVGVESRTSSPVKIPRNELLEHPDLSRLYPCGEGAGYAGGIVSAAMDGERCVKAFFDQYGKKLSKG
ncbi:MAG: FAD-dependent oxidoreductase [Bacteroidota bacterium]